MQKTPEPALDKSRRPQLRLEGSKPALTGSDIGLESLIFLFSFSRELPLPTASQGRYFVKATGSTQLHRTQPSQPLPYDCSR